MGVVLLRSVLNNRRQVASRACLLSGAVMVLALLGACERPTEQKAVQPSIATVLSTDATIAAAVYEDSVIAVGALKDQIVALIDSPSLEALQLTRAAWLAAREPYGQSEVYRFRLGPIDSLDGKQENGPEGRINAWPLGEAMIDYVANRVDGDSGPEANRLTISRNIIADQSNVPTLNKAVLSSLNEQGGDERNVTTGFHAIEFLLWGQDQNQNADAWDGVALRDTTSGHRPSTDFAADELCTSGINKPSPKTICARRNAYLLSVTELLIDDLSSVAARWNPVTGDHYAKVVAGGLPELTKILESMGRLSFGELAGERINIALTQNSQEDEHSCFSDNTHRDIVLNVQAIENAFVGSYKRIDGSIISGPSLASYLAEIGQSKVATELLSNLTVTRHASLVIDELARKGEPFDRQIQEGGINDPEILAVIQALVKQTATIEKAIASLGIYAPDLRQDTAEKI